MDPSLPLAEATPQEIDVPMECAAPNSDIAVLMDNIAIPKCLEIGEPLPVQSTPENATRADLDSIWEDPSNPILLVDKMHQDRDAPMRIAALNTDTVELPMPIAKPTKEIGEPLDALEETMLVSEIISSTTSPTQSISEKLDSHLPPRLPLLVSWLLHSLLCKPHRY